MTKASGSARRSWERLQRISIVVDIELAPSQRSVIADRVTLRRIYCPAFATTLTSSEHLQLTKEQFEWFMDRPEEFCVDYYQRVTKQPSGPTLWGDSPPEPEIMMVSEPQSVGGRSLPSPTRRRDFAGAAPPTFLEFVSGLPALEPATASSLGSTRFDIFVGALGFEERTTSALERLQPLGLSIGKGLVFEFDMYYSATERRRPKYHQLLQSAARLGYQPINAPVGSPDPRFHERLRLALEASAGGSELPTVLFDCTSCPSLVLAKALRSILSFPCHLTLLYSEASLYYPTREEWESGKVVAVDKRVEGLFSGVRYVDKPGSLQSDDAGERPVLLILFPTFNTERTAGVLTDIEPAKRVWLIGQPHEIEANSYRVEMGKRFAAPNMYPEDAWGIVTTSDYRESMAALATIYAENSFGYRAVVMPHGSKMQTLGVSLFSLAHEISMVFAVPLVYNTDRYSEGCQEVWAVTRGRTETLVEKLRASRVIGNGVRR